MKNNFTKRTSLIIGEDGKEKLHNAKVLVVGVGGVGSFAVEALARAGLGNITIVDYAVVEIEDFNRQLPGLTSNLEEDKVKVVGERLLDINPELNIRTFKCVFNEETSKEIFNDNFDFVIDAIDMVSSKIHLIEECKKRNIKIISSMGMGNKLDPTKIEIDDIYNTSVCPLAKVMRKELRNRNIKELKVVYSKEKPIEVKEKISNGHRILPGSTSFLSPCGGMIIASFVIRELIK